MASNDRVIEVDSCDIEIVKDKNNNDILVATVTNNHDRIVRLVSKFHMAVTLEVAYVHHIQYQWVNDCVGVDIDELIELGKIALKLKELREQEEA